MVSVKSLFPTSLCIEEISFWGNRMVLSGAIYHKHEQCDCSHYTPLVNMDNTWFLISDTRILR